MRLLLDTATFIWAIASPERLSATAASAIEPAVTEAEISSISITEIAIKHSKKKLNLAQDVVAAAIDRFKLQVLPYTAKHGYYFFELPWHHVDPFDRMIIAQALCEGIPVVTSDAKFRAYKELEVIW
ncbi:MAG: type II toxin-antitoxin system VapC family toxin [Acidobacteria bacterium]|nr:type II toxin-antitoxin system VapC family toxin [Acidobacteriota bacterium]MBV9147140.1 type II toxin-antitoxin system VapC family toxin [Acidobacteriota bacterium]MBV9437830.1 type II toxin-antitoxin system VapC family toxin [Acidobacteriota bacterium]